MRVLYTKILNVQILVSLLKQHDIKHLVLSAGTRHVPLAHSVENDSFFKCYSVVDERSAAYFAMGLSKEIGEPVAIACTSSTATCNYVPAIAEAYYQKVPLLVLTGDRDPYFLDQMEDQMINQVDMYKNFCSTCVNLPVVENEKDVWYCQRLINEALLELNHHGSGPVQINFPINQTIEDIADASVPELPEYNKIIRLDYEIGQSVWKEKVEQLKKAKRILIVCGSSVPYSKETLAKMEQFAVKYNCVFATERLSNLHFNGSMDTYLLAESISVSVLRTIAPDVVIFFGGNFVSRWKPMLKSMSEMFESWLISDNGIVMDPFRNLSTVFECSLHHFFDYFAENAGKISNNKELLKDLQRYQDNINMPTMEELYEKVNAFKIGDAKFKLQPPPTEEQLLDKNKLTAFSAMYYLAQKLPKKSLLHLSILNSTRIMQMFSFDTETSVYSNIGTDGIDGSMSTFFGQATASERPCFLVIGDLSFFYDMNSLGIRNIGKNVHILLVNNGGGAEFYFSMGPERLPNIDLHISAGHQKRAKEWVEANGISYMQATTNEEYCSILPEFVSKEGPVLLEIFTEKKKDIDVLKGFRRMIHQETTTVAAAKKIEKIPGVKKVLDTSAGQKIKGGIKKLLQ